MERVSGFEPEMSGSAVRRLCPLGYTRGELEGTTGHEPASNNLNGCLLDPLCIHPLTGMRGKIRTFIDLFLRQVPLRLGYTHMEWSERQDSNLRILVPKTSPYGLCRNALMYGLASGQGFEPRSTGSEPAILPVRRSRKKIGEDGRTRTYNLLIRIQLL
jgi:hypothetical protein